MKKSDLKQNMIVEFRNGDKYLVLENVETLYYGHQDLLFINSDGYETGDHYDEDLNIKSKDWCMSDFDIIKVMKWKGFRDFECLNKDKADSFEILWERQETIKWQPWELEVLKHIQPYFNEIAMGSNSNIFVRNDEAQCSHFLRLNLPSLLSTKANEPQWLNIDEELARNGMKREDEQ